jgi:parvulin-like peptidyl-prolyl isomerase
MDAMLKQQGLTADEIRNSIVAGKQVDRIVAEITAGIPEPTEEELREYFDAHQEDYSSPERASAQHILVKPKSDSNEGKQDARRRLNDIRREFEDGADFGELAEKHSDCASGRKAAGQLGWIHRGTMVPEFEDVLFSTPPGELSQIVETPLGLHIILPTDYEEEQPASFEQAKEMVRALLSHSMKGKAISEYTQKLRAGVLIEDDPS